MIPEQTWALRQQILIKYGAHCQCPCGCGDANLRHLQLDHRDGGGEQERNTKHLRGERLYAKLLAGALRSDLLLLCANCHWEKSCHGECHGSAKLPSTLGMLEERKEMQLIDISESTPGVTPKEHSQTPTQFSHLEPSTWTREVPEHEAAVVVPPKRRWLWGR